MGVLLGVMASAWAIHHLQQTLPVLIDNGVPSASLKRLSVIVVVLGVAVGGVNSRPPRTVRLRWWPRRRRTAASADVLIRMFTARWEVAWYVPRLIGALTGALLMVLFAEVAAQSRSITALRVRDRLLDAEELREAAETDPLTGCLNRRGLDAHFSALSQTPRFAKPVFAAVYFVDLDNFKNINDGFLTRSEIPLRIVAEALRRSVRASDLVARYGGDEFVVVAEGLRSLNDADRSGADVRPSDRRRTGGIIAGQSGGDSKRWLRAHRATWTSGICHPRSRAGDAASQIRGKEQISPGSRFVESNTVKLRRRSLCCGAIRWTATATCDAPKWLSVVPNLVAKVAFTNRGFFAI